MARVLPGGASRRSSTRSPRRARSAIRGSWSRVRTTGTSSDDAAVADEIARVRSAAAVRRRCPLPARRRSSASSCDRDGGRLRDGRGRQLRRVERAVPTRAPVWMQDAGPGVAVPVPPGAAEDVAARAAGQRRGSPGCSCASSCAAPRRRRRRDTCASSSPAVPATSAASRRGCCSTAGTSCVVLDTLEKGHREAVDAARGARRRRRRRSQGARGRAARLRRGDAPRRATSRSPSPRRDPERYLDNNVTRPARHARLDGAARASRAIVFSSTAAVYGEPASVPIPEDARHAAREQVRREQAGCSSRSCASARPRGELRAVRLRYFNVAGAWPDGSLGEAHDPETHIIPRILSAMAAGEREFEVFGGDYPTADGTCVRDYIHVLDLAQRARARARAARRRRRRRRLQPRQRSRLQQPRGRARRARR